MQRIRIIMLMTGVCFAFLGTPGFTQEQYIGAVPINYIPSFAGSAEVSRFASYTSALNGCFVQTLAYDAFLEKISSGIGIKLEYQNTPFYLAASRSRYHAELITSPKISLKGKYTFSPALSITYRYYDFIERVGNFAMPDPLHTLNYKASLLINSRKFYLGYSVELDPYNKVYRSQPNFDAIHVLQAGYSFQKYQDSQFTFTPQLLLKHFKLKYNDAFGLYSNLNLNFRYRSLLAGIGNKQAMLGWQNRTFRIMAVFDYTEEVIGDHLYGSYFSKLLSISLRYQLTGTKSGEI